MKNQITIEKAIKRGHRMVNVPAFIITFATIGLGFYLSNQAILPYWIIPISFSIGFGGGWLWWSCMITKWRIWAFENVSNVHQLKKRAILERLIWADGSIFEKTACTNAADKAKLLQLDTKFEQDDEFIADCNLPDKMEIHYSKTTNFFKLGLSTLIMGVGLYILIAGITKQFSTAILMAGIGLYGSIKKFRIAIDTKPRIIIGSDGIQTKNVAFKNWAAIENEEIVIEEGFWKGPEAYLTYCYDEDGFEKIEINHLDVTIEELEIILRTYRMRSAKDI